MKGIGKTILHARGGRDNKGQVSVRHRGGGSKKFLRPIDFKKGKENLLGKIVDIRYDPNRTSRIALVFYPDGEKRYVLANNDLKIGDSIGAGANQEIKNGNHLPLGKIPIGTMISNIELTKGRGGQIVRSAGSCAYVLAQEEKFTQVKLPSGELRRINNLCSATVGQVGYLDWKLKKFGKAGAKRRRGIRPVVRGTAQNPRSHPHGGGEGRSGIGMPGPKTYAGRSAVGKTRKKRKYSDKMILERRKK